MAISTIQTQIKPLPRLYAIGSVLSKGMGVLANISLTIAKNALPDVYERMLLGGVLSFGKEAILKGGAKCIALTALQGLFGNIDTRYETYWKSKTWSDLISSNYLNSIYEGMSRIISEPKEIGPLLNDLSKFTSNVVGNLFSDSSSYCTESLCPENSPSVKIAAFFTALYIVFASIRITRAVANSIFPSKTQELDDNLRQEIQALAQELSEIKNFKEELLEKLDDVSAEDEAQEIDDIEELEDDGIEDLEELDDIEELDDESFEEEDEQLCNEI